MSEYLRIPREKIHVVHPGINWQAHASEPEAFAKSDRPFTIGYFARICPEKGLHQLVDAFCLLKKMPNAPPCRLHISGWLGQEQMAYLKAQMDKVERADHAADVRLFEAPDHASKVRFLQGLDVLSVPTTYREPKGLYLLEAWAHGVPVVQPAHGSFPELIEATGGGLLVPPNETQSLASALRHLAENHEERRRLGELGRVAVRERFDSATMARATVDLYLRYVRT
jgi:glycosyltransferase involved in cell wall biosynthesis